MVPDKTEVKIRKVTPYPFDITIKNEVQSIVGKVIKVTSKGFFADLNGEMVGIGKYFDVNFLIPVLKEGVLTRARVIRFFDRAMPNTTHHDSSEQAAPQSQNEQKSKVAIQRLVEMHFSSLSPEHKNKIEAFCKAIRQDDR